MLGAFGENLDTIGQDLKNLNMLIITNNFKMKTKRLIIFLISLMVSSVAFSQVGVGTIEPKATLDIIGTPTDVSVVDGIFSPRLTGDELKAKDAAYGADNTGAMVYVTSAAAPTTTKTVNVVSEGYYYFDGAVWQRMTSKPSNLTTLQMNAIVNPIEGMEVYNSDAKCTSNSFGYI